MRPAWSDIDWPAASPIVALADGRNWLGVYGDTSVDAEVQACLDAAVEKVADFVGFRITDTRIADYFPRTPAWGCGFANVLELSAAGIDTATLSVKYLDAAGAEQTLAETAWRLDPTQPGYAVVLDEMPALSDRHMNPLWAVYRSKLADIRGAPAAGRLKLAVRMVATQLWRARPEPVDPHVLDKALYSLLAAARREAPV